MGWLGNGNEDAVNSQYEYDQQMYEYNLGLRDDKYEFQLDQYEIEKWNLESTRNYRNETAVNDWTYRQQMREFDYNNQIAAYNASVETYEEQMEYNNLAADLTNADNTRGYNEKLIAIGYQNEELVNKFGFETVGMTKEIEAKRAAKAFESEKLKVNALEQEGVVRAGGAVGRSARKNMGAVMAAYGMQQAALADSITRDDDVYEFGMKKASTEFNLGSRQLKDSMKSAKAQYEADQQHVQLEKYAADMAARNNIASPPVLPPEMPAPLEIPKTETLAPVKPTQDPPRPIKGAISKPSLGGLLMNVATSALTGFIAKSDDRLKYDITRVGTSPSGVPEYTFKYRLDGEHGPTYKGTSAQDLLDIGRKDAVGQTEKDGFYYVDYSKLDVDFEQVQLA